MQALHQVLPWCTTATQPVRRKLLDFAQNQRNQAGI
jgi:hypothetical protein